MVLGWFDCCFWLLIVYDLLEWWLGFVWGDLLFVWWCCLVGVKFRGMVWVVCLGCLRLGLCFICSCCFCLGLIGGFDWFWWMCFIDFVILVLELGLLFWVFRNSACLVGLVCFAFCGLLCFGLFRVDAWWFGCFELWFCWFVGLFWYGVWVYTSWVWCFGVLTNSLF